jgi:arylsulfatase A-like enzyme
MIVRWPGVTLPGSKTDACLIIEDFFPSILEMANISAYETVQEVDGQSFTAILKDKQSPPNDRPLFWHLPNNWGPRGPGLGPSSTIRKGDWKLIYYHTDQSFELFNITDDIGESTNLEGQDVEVRTELARQLGDYLRSVDAQMPTCKETGKQVPWPDEMNNQEKFE